MTDNGKHGFNKKQGLTQTEFTEIEVLAALCNRYEELELKLNWNILRNRPAHETNDCASCARSVCRRVAVG